MKALTLVSALLLTLATHAFAQSDEVDLNFAFSQMKGNGAVPFSKALYGSDTEKARVLVDHLTPLVQWSGNFEDFELISRRYLSKKIERLVLVMYFEKFPVYMRIDYYQTSKGRIFLTAKFSKEAAEILPFDLISATGK